MYWFRRSRSVLRLAKGKKSLKKKSWRNLQNPYECNSVLIFYWCVQNASNTYASWVCSTEILIPDGSITGISTISITEILNLYQGSHFQSDFTLGEKRKWVSLFCRCIWNWFPLPSCHTKCILMCLSFRCAFKKSILAVLDF